jgi:hypothetical protein
VEGLLVVASASLALLHQVLLELPLQRMALQYQ